MVISRRKPFDTVGVRSCLQSAAARNKQRYSATQQRRASSTVADLETVFVSLLRHIVISCSKTQHYWFGFDHCKFRLFKINSAPLISELISPRIMRKSMVRGATTALWVV